MKTLTVLILALLPFAASAAKFGAIGRPADMPQGANGRDVVQCESARTIYSDAPQQACLTAGQRMTSSANAEALASQKALSDRAVQAARAAQDSEQDGTSH